MAASLLKEFTLSSSKKKKLNTNNDQLDLSKDNTAPAQTPIRLPAGSQGTISKMEPINDMWLTQVEATERLAQAMQLRHDIESYQKRMREDDDLTALAVEKAEEFKSAATELHQALVEKKMQREREMEEVRMIKRIATAVQLGAERAPGAGNLGQPAYDRYEHHLSDESVNGMRNALKKQIGVLLELYKNGNQHVGIVEITAYCPGVELLGKVLEVPFPRVAAPKLGAPHQPKYEVWEVAVGPRESVRLFGDVHAYFEYPDNNYWLQVQGGINAHLYSDGILEFRCRFGRTTYPVQQRRNSVPKITINDSGYEESEVDHE